MPTSELLRLLQRRATLEQAMRGRGGIKVTEERELQRLRETLDQHAGPARELLAAASRLGRPVDAITIDDLRLEH
jgi:hypothetical protein